MMFFLTKFAIIRYLLLIFTTILIDKLVEDYIDLTRPNNIYVIYSKYKNVFFALKKK